MYVLAFTLMVNVTIMTSLLMIHTLNLKCYYWMEQKDVLLLSHMIGHLAVPNAESAHQPMGIKQEPVIPSVRRARDQTNTVGRFKKRSSLNSIMIDWDADKYFENLSSVPKFPNDSNPQSSGEGNSNIEVFADYPITRREINSRKGLVLRNIFRKILKISSHLVGWTRLLFWKIF